jgi:hypothetical protein
VSLVRVCVESSEFIAGRGSGYDYWLFQDGEEWHSVTKHPTAVVTQQDAPRGVVWCKSIELQLEPGTLLERRRSRPREVVYTDVMQYLAKGTPRQPLQVAAARFVVGRRGNLMRSGKQRKAA